jgi:hypothetical protein
MKHEKYKEWLLMNILDELNEQEQIELENHLLECDECNEEYAQFKKLYSTITSGKNELITETDLANSRKRLFNTINSMPEKVSFAGRIKNYFDQVFAKKYSFALGSVALLLVGFFIGYLIFNKVNISPKTIVENSIDLDKIERGEIKIADVNLPKTFSKTGEFVFTLGDQNPFIYKGNLNDVIVQKLLAAAYKETDNPGFKIKTAKTLTRFMPTNFKPDEKIKSAFITTLKTDRNPGVRKGALQALINFPYDKEIRDALLYTLQNDDNASNRMDAINVLLAMNTNKDSIDYKIKNELQQKNSNEENEIVKFRTAKLLLGDK